MKVRFVVVVTLASHNYMWLARAAVVVTGCDGKYVVVAGAGGIDMEVASGGRDMVGTRGSNVVGVVVNVVEAGASDSGTVEGDGASGGGMVDLGLFDRHKMSYITCSWCSFVY